MTLRRSWCAAISAWRSATCCIGKPCSAPRATRARAYSLLRISPRSRMVHQNTSDAVRDERHAEHDELGAFRKPLSQVGSHQAFPSLASTSSSLSRSAVGVSRREEADLVRRRRQVHPARQPAAVPAVVLGHRRPAEWSMAPRRATAPVGVEIRPDDRSRRAAAAQRLPTACRAYRGIEMFAQHFEMSVDPAFGELLERRDAGGERTRDFRPSCPPGRPDPSGASCCSSSRRPSTAATGRPPPTILPSVVRSGSMPNNLS